MSDNNPWFWKQILKVRDKMRPLVCFRMGNGGHVRFWQDSWLDVGRLDGIFSANYISRNGIRKDAYVADLIKEGKWLWPSMRHYSIVDLKQLVGDDLQIKEGQDVVIWNKHVDFSIHNAMTF